MKIWKYSLILLCLFNMTGCHKEHSKNKTHQLLQVGVCSDYPPFAYSKQGKLVGFDIDLIEKIAQEMNMSVTFLEMAHHNLIPALQTQKIDLAACGLTITPQRQKNIDFTEQYYQATLAMIYRKEAQPDFNDFSHKKIGVQLGTTMEQAAKKIHQEFKDVEISSMDSNPALIEKLKLGVVDFILIESVQAAEFCKMNPILTYQEIGKAEEGYGIALTKGSIFLTKVNAALNNLLANGTTKSLQQKWEL